MKIFFLFFLFLTASYANPAYEMLAKDSYADTLEALPLLNEAELNALKNKQLFINADKTITINKGETEIRTNNRVRGAIEQALSSKTLLNADPAKRLQAADTLFKSRDKTTLNALQKAIETEKTPAIKRAFEEAEAAINIAQNTITPAFLKRLEARGDGEALSLLKSISPQTDLIQKSISEIERKEQARLIAQNLWYGLSLGSVLLLASIGLAITFGVMGVINMAHGEMVMLGAYTTYVTQLLLKAFAPSLFEYSLVFAVPLAFLLTALVGVALEKLVIAKLYGRPLETLLATFGVSLILQQAIRTGFGSSNKEVVTPAFMSGSFDLFGIAVNYSRLSILIFTIVVFLLLLALMRFSSMGLNMRAVTQNRRMASSMGINTSKTDALTFGLGSGIAGIAGVALAQIDNVSPNLGQSYIIDSFMVVVFGGVGNLWGTLISAFTLGIANKLLEPFAGAVLAKIFILIGLILFIQKKPRGLFALKGRFVE
jgi:urea transport system permease protein